LAHPPKTGPLTRLGFPCNSSPELQEKSNEEEAVYGRADCADAAGGPGSRSDGGPASAPMTGQRSGCVPAEPYPVAGRWIAEGIRT